METSKGPDKEAKLFTKLETIKTKDNSRSSYKIDYERLKRSSSDSRQKSKRGRIKRARNSENKGR